MQAKFFYAGAGAKVPGTEFGLSAGAFKIWLAPVGQSFKGYTTASNQGLGGLAVVESSIVDFVMTDLETEEPFMKLHGSTVDVTISPSTFVRDGGVATLTLTLKGNASVPPLSFTCDECKGFAATIGDIHFVATLLELPADETDATQQSMVPW